MTPHFFHDALPPAGQPRGRGSSRRWSQRTTTVLLASGGFALLTGGLFLLPFVITTTAIQNDVYMGNYLIGPLFLVAGGICLAMGLLSLGMAHAGHRRILLMRALLLAVAGAVAVAVANLLFGGRYYSVGPSAPDWPPYLTLEILVVAVVVGIAVCVAGWVWGAGTEGPA